MYTTKPGLRLVFFLFFIHLIISCDNSTGDNEGDLNEVIKTGSVTFFNESSYNVKIHQDSFSGPVLLELSAGDPATTIPVRISDAHGYGTTFSIEYLVPIRGDDFDSASVEIIASGFDFDMQPPYVIEEGKSYTIQIRNPAPGNMEFKTSFILIFNIHNLPVELRDHGRTLRQVGSGNIPIAQGKFGIYKLEGIPSDGELYQGYKIVSSFTETPVLDFFVENGYKYTFTFDGTSAHDGSLEKKPEPKREPLEVGRK